MLCLCAVAMSPAAVAVEGALQEGTHGCIVDAASSRESGRTSPGTQSNCKELWIKIWHSTIK